MSILMVIEASKARREVRLGLHHRRRSLIAISVTVPLFLLARELRLEKSDATYLRGTDSILLALLAIVTVAFMIWVDLF